MKKTWGVFAEDPDPGGVNPKPPKGGNGGGNGGGSGDGD